MMRIVLQLLIILSFSATCSNISVAVNLENANEVNKTIIQKWRSSHTETRNNRTEIPKSQTRQIAFAENGTFISKIEDAVIENKGTWSYDPKTHILYMVNEGQKILLRILKLSENEFILSEFFMLNDKIVDSTVITYKKD